jgi:hypothetical protein
MSGQESFMSVWNFVAECRQLSLPLSCSEKLIDLYTIRLTVYFKNVCLGSFSLSKHTLRTLPMCVERTFQLIFIIVFFLSNNQPTLHTFLSSHYLPPLFY